MITYADLLVSENKALVKSLLTHVTKEMFQFLLNVCANYIGNADIAYSREVQRRLKRFHRDIERVSSKKVSVAVKKRILAARGSRFIPLLVKQHRRLYREL